mgnify:CR=1 FL=1
MGKHPTFMSNTSLILKRDRLGRVRTPLERRAMVVEEFKRSGLTARKFAQLVGVHYNTFWNWLHEQGLTAKRGQGRKQTKPRLVEVCVKRAAACPPLLPDGLPVALPGGAHLVLRDAAQVTLAAQLLKALA